MSLRTVLALRSCTSAASTRPRSTMHMTRDATQAAVLRDAELQTRRSLFVPFVSHVPDNGTWGAVNFRVSGPGGYVTKPQDARIQSSHLSVASPVCSRYAP